MSNAQCTVNGVYNALIGIGMTRADWQLRTHAHYAYSVVRHSVSTGCGTKKSPIWEANKFKTKEDTTNVFFYFWKVHRMPFYINVF